MNARNKINFAVVIASLGVAATGSRAASSVGDIALEEIVVTAQKREENLQETPIAVTAVSSQDLANINASSLFDVARVAPNVQFGGGGLRGFFFIRGIGQSQQGMLSDPGATLYIDGVYRPRFSNGSANLSDVERMEILRGPQGTLFGKNAVGGAVNIITGTPGEDFGAKLNVELGSRNHFKTDVAANLPISDTLFARVSYDRDTQRGYMHNLAADNWLDGVNRYTTRGALLWKATDDVSLTLRGDYTNINQGGQGPKLTHIEPASPVVGDPLTQPYLAGDYQTYSGSPGLLRSQDKGVSATLDWKLGPGAFKSISAYRKYHAQNAEETDGTPNLIQAINNLNDQHFFSQELQYNAQSLGDALNWTVGAFYMDESTYDLEKGTFLGFLSFNNLRTQSDKSYAAFGQATYNFNPEWALTAGLRYSRDQKEAAFTDFSLPVPDVTAPPSVSWSSTTPKVTLEYKPAETLMFYATASEGFKAGGFNQTPLDPKINFLPFEPEKLWNYEAGMKSEWLDKRLRLNLAVYRMNYKDIQIVVEDTASQSPSLYMLNAGDARINGLEGELTVLVTRALSINASVGINDFKYTRLVDLLTVDRVNAGRVPVKTDNILANSPRTTASIGAEYLFNLDAAGTITTRADYNWRSKVYYDIYNTESISQDSFGLLSARITYRPAQADWSAFLYGTNLTGEVYHHFGQTVSDAFANFNVLYQGRPREFGVGFNMRFGK